MVASSLPLIRLPRSVRGNIAMPSVAIDMYRFKTGGFTPL